MSNFNPAWYLIYTRPKQERKVASQLEEKEIGYFLPTIRRISQWHDRKRIILAPLFPSYVFVKLASLLQFFSAGDCEGVCGYVKIGKQPAMIRDKVIENISLLINNFKDIDASPELFRAGQQLLIREGALTGLECEVVKHDGKKKILVRVELLNRNLLVDLPVEHVMYNDRKFTA